MISLAIVGALGAMLFRFVLRSTVGRPHFVAVIATLGFAAVADGVIGIVFPANAVHDHDSGTFDWLNDDLRGNIQ